MAEIYAVYVEKYNVDGFVVIPGVFPGGEVNVIRAAPDYGRQHPKTDSIAQAFLPGCTWLFTHVNKKSPDLYESFGWHQDITFRDGPGEYLQIGIVLDAMTVSNGPIHFVPGSHKLGDLNLLKDRNDQAIRTFRPDAFPHSVRVFPSAGDVLVWSVMTAHGSGPNKSRKNREMHVHGFKR